MSALFDVQVLGYVRHNGVRYAPGKVIRGLTEQEAENLVRLGVGRIVATVEASSTGPDQTPPDPSTPWGLVALSAVEAAKHIAQVDNPKFLNAVQALEELREKPRATVLQAIEARRQEIAKEFEPQKTGPVDPPAGSPPGPAGEGAQPSTGDPSGGDEGK